MNDFILETHVEMMIELFEYFLQFFAVAEVLLKLRFSFNEKY